MKLKGYLGDAAHDIEVRPAPHGFVVSVDGVEREVDAANLEASFYSLIIDGVSFDVSVHEIGHDGYVVRHGGFARQLRILDPLSAAASASAATAGPVPVDAIMPGRVVKLLVAAGDDVKEGQALLVLEAMKMENDIPSPKTGKIAEICVAAGQAVETGEKLVVVE
jgi:acetyl/propionyl-CoA carboxylase alpha subunit